MKRKSLILALVTVVLWGSLAPLAKILLSSMPDLEVLFLGSTAAFLFLFVVNLVTGKLKLLSLYRWRDLAYMTGLGFVGLFLYHAFYYAGIASLSAQEACIINYLWPIMTVVFSCLILKEKLTPAKAGALLLSFAGIAVLFLGDVSLLKGSAAGVLCCLLAPVCYGWYSIMNRKLSYDENILMMMSWLVTALCSLFGVLSGDWVPGRVSDVPGILWIGIVTNGAAYLFWALALKGAGNVAGVANLAYLTPFLSVLLSAVVLKEKITVRAVLALVLIIGGVLWQSLAGEGKKKAIRV